MKELVKKCNVNRILVAICFVVTALILTGRSKVFATTSSNYYVSDSHSIMHGKTLRLYYDNQGHVIEDTTGITGGFSNYEIYVNKNKDIQK